MTDMQLLSYEPAPGRAPARTRGETPAVIALPRPDMAGGVPLMKALALRASTREFSDTPLMPATLGALLWAADGVNRPATGGRTAPSAHAFNEIDLYAVLPNGVYRYDAPNHRLVLKQESDARNMTGYQDFVGDAPLDLVYVVNMSRLLTMPPQQRDIFSAVTAGAMAQNVSLYCASAGLGCVVRGWINHRSLSDAPLGEYPARSRGGKNPYRARAARRSRPATGCIEN
ncbi:SagB/ThcOx family dehydrogenase [Paraburkholderia tuberum]|uniref:Nitroreductase family protein n=1 Tax=Paraburkholderia tuberum TaxID=157910 RepID=A0A1H1HCS9_9BURK|nr:SagB/ThcOx family dehydrogenase [Paraburkholderia tuberum]SDR23292.1 Nitroreductase family protein [Paraburkholderia tuberum]